MEIAGQHTIRAPRAAVWAALNDAEILGRCIPGCESISTTAPDSYVAVIALKVGPVSARFRGTVTLEDKREGEGYRIVGSGSGGAAGFAKGEARIDLGESGGATLVDYTANVEIGGKIASLGARMMRRVAEGNAQSFFNTLEEVITGAPAPARPSAPPPPSTFPSARYALLDRLAWFGAGVGATLTILMLTGIV